MEASQTDVLTEVANWDLDLCRERLEETLPRVVGKLKSGLADEKLVAVQVICNSFLPSVKLKSINHDVFSNISKEIVSMFDEFLSLIKENLHRQLSENQRESEIAVTDSMFEAVQLSLRNILTLLESVEACISCVLRLEERVTIGDVRSLPDFVIYLIEKTYKHCKDSSEIYGDSLGLFSEVLSALFKKSHAIQISFLSLLDRLQLPDSLVAFDVDVLNSVCTGLFKICQTVTALDVKLIVSLWKSISRLLVQYIQFLSDVVDVTAMVVYLCEEVRNGYHYLQQQVPGQPDTSWTLVDEKGFQKSVKIFGFEMKIILSLCKEYLEHLREDKCDKEIYELLMFIYTNSPSLVQKSFRLEHREEIERQILTTCEPLLVTFIERSVFRKLLLGPVNTPQEGCLAHLQMLVSVTKSFSKLSEGSQDYWMGETKPYETKCDNIVDTIFQVVEKCYAELGDLGIVLPGIMCSGTAQKLISLYEYVVTHLNGFIGSLLNSYFPILERSLLTWLFSSNQFVQSLAVDSWCFMDRYGSSELCRSHFNLLLDVLIDQCQCHPDLLPDQQICLLIGRLFKFLEPADQSEVMNERSAPVDFVFWCVCPFAYEQLQQQGRAVVNDVISCCVAQINMWVESTNENKHIVSLNNVVQACGSLNNVLHHMPLNKAAELVPAVAEKLSLIWKYLLENEWDACLQTDYFLSVLLQLLPSTYQHFSDETLTHIFMLLKELLLKNPSSLFLMTIVKLISAMSSVKFTAPEIPGLLQDVLLNVLSNQNGLVNHVALEAVTAFAEITPHGEIVPKCLQRDLTIEPKLVKFINKQLVTELDVKGYLTSQCLKVKNEKPLTWIEENVRQEEKSRVNQISLSDLPPVNKRARLDEVGDELSFKTLLKNLESDWTTFEELCKCNPVPDWFKSSSMNIVSQFQERLNNIK